jgi:hypothetical protein
MVKPVEPEWGALAGDGPLSPVEIEAKARALLAQMPLAEKIKQMSGDRSFLFGSIRRQDNELNWLTEALRGKYGL